MITVPWLAYACKITVPLLAIQSKRSTEIKMRIARLEIVRFRGFESLVLVPRDNVLVVGEPRAGRSDLIAAVRRVLDPRAVQARPSEWDVFRPLPESGDHDGAAPPLTSIEVSLMDLSEEVEQDLDERLELLSAQTGEVPDTSDVAEAELGIRLAYCLRYDPAEQQLEHWLEYPKSGFRVPRLEREALRGFFLERNPPLQLRAEGALRRLASEPDPGAFNATLQAFAREIATATDTLAGSAEVQAALKLIVNKGPKRLLELDETDPTSAIGFTAEDGSMTALLRAIQPTLELNTKAGMLPLSNHGSTTAAVLATAEAAAAAQADHATVLADDFGDELDAAATEYLAARLRRRAGQLWLTSRRPEVIAAFDATEIVRLTLHTGVRKHFQLAESADRKERVRRRHLSTLLAPAMSAETVVLLEGPHDFETYSALDRRRFLELNKIPLAALGMRFVAASAAGGEGGKSELPKLARLATDVGLAVRVVLDHDKPGTDEALIDELRTTAELIVRLPERTAVERAIVDGLAPDVLRPVLETLSAAHVLGLTVDDIDDDGLPLACIKALKQKGGLHRLFIDLLPRETVPELANNVLLRLLRSAPPDDPLVTLADV